METCGHAPYERLEGILPLVDFWLYDWKETQPERHREFTGVSNHRIRDNLRRLVGAGAQVRLRCPIIPGYNDRTDHFEGIAELAASLPELEGVEIMPYHRLGEGKRDRMGIQRQEPREISAPTDETTEAWREKLRRLGVPLVQS
jgi:pyruvate formate lyase activating enzyme